MNTKVLITSIALIIAANGAVAGEGFSTVNGIPAQAMSQSEMAATEGKHFVLPPFGPPPSGPFGLPPFGPFGLPPSGPNNHFISSEILGSVALNSGQMANSISNQTTSPISTSNAGVDQVIANPPIFFGKEE